MDFTVSTASGLASINAAVEALGRPAEGGVNPEGAGTAVDDATGLAAATGVGAEGVVAWGAGGGDAARRTGAGGSSIAARAMVDP